MVRNGFISVLVVVGIVAGCATGPMAALPKHAPVDRAELDRNVDAVLAYVSGSSGAAPDGLLAPAPRDKSDKVDEHDPMTAAECMREHCAEVAALKSQGVLGEDNRGYLELRNTDLFATPADKNAVQKAMAVENDCRKTLYRGIARAGEEKGLTLTRVERAFAARRLAKATSGAVVQAPSNDDEYALFQESALGKQLGAAVKPGEWITLP
ncbi:MAG: DUF1318 domain-containing protein [Candidatus Hydrogenedentes bacterium]|nr:DUF1318 domain-containing protein [Candidatus Hydrogenedentota bacterium]